MAAPKTELSPAKLRALLRALLPLAHHGCGPFTSLKIRRLINEGREAVGQKPYEIPGEKQAPQVLEMLRKHGPIEGEKLAVRMDWGRNVCGYALRFLGETGQARRINVPAFGSALSLGEWEAVPEGETAAPPAPKKKRTRG